MKTDVQTLDAKTAATLHLPTQLVGLEPRPPLPPRTLP